MIKTDRRIFVRLFVLCEKSKKNCIFFTKHLKKNKRCCIIYYVDVCLLNIFNERVRADA